MKVDNRLRTAKLKIMYTISGIVIFALSMYLYFEHHQVSIYPIAFGYVLPGSIIVLVLLYIILLFRRLNYFFIEFLGKKIVVRYYSAYPIFRKYKAFEIPKSYFYDYKIKTQLLGFIKTITFIVDTPKGKFSYPPISITLLSGKEFDNLIKMLGGLKK